MIDKPSECLRPTAAPGVVLLFWLCLTGLASGLWAHTGKVALAQPGKPLRVDGDLGDWPRQAPKHILQRLQLADEGGASAYFQVAYSAAEEALYVAATIADQTVDAGDGCGFLVGLHAGGTGRGAPAYLVWDSADTRLGRRYREVEAQYVALAKRQLPGRRIYEWRLSLRGIGAAALDTASNWVLGFNVVAVDFEPTRRHEPAWMSWTADRAGRRRFFGLGDLIVPSAAFPVAHLRGTATWEAPQVGLEPPAQVALEALPEAALKVLLNTDARGAYSVDLPAGTYRLQIDDLRIKQATPLLVQVDSGQTLAPVLKAVRTDPSLYYRPVAPGSGQRQRGVSWVAAHYALGEYDLLPLAKNGVNWIVQTPFGWQRQFNSTDIRMRTEAGRYWSGESDAGLEETTLLARKFGIKTLLKPHLWLNDRSNGKWRGEISMDSEAAWDLWFASYGEFITHYARLAERLGIEIFCIGTELHKPAVERQTDWRRLIKAIRQVYSGQLVYAANWYGEFEEIQFWDELDFIGIQAYFPLVQHKNPSVEELVAAWAPHLEAIEALQQRYRKPVIITEIGYHSTVSAAIAPWEWRPAPGERIDSLGMQTQVNCYEAFFRVFWPQPWFAGAYIWKWFADHRNVGGTDDGNFTPQNKPAEAVMGKWYTQERARVAPAVSGPGE